MGVALKIVLYLVSDFEVVLVVVPIVLFKNLYLPYSSLP